MTEKFNLLLNDLYLKFINFNKIIRKNTLLLLRLDAIGDYILFRNFIGILKESQRYREYKITLVGNIAWKDLAENLDKDYIDRFIWIDRNRFEKDPRYRYEKLKEITSTGYEVVINPTYSRAFIVEDAIVNVVNAKEKIGSTGDFSNISKIPKIISDTFYTRLIPARKEIIFEFYRNQEFFSYLLNEDINIRKPVIELKKKNTVINLPERYVVIFLGAKDPFRKWKSEYFVEVGKVLKEKYGYEIVLCGGKSDLKDAYTFREKASYSYIDLIGKTSLLDLLYVLKGSSILLSNETAAPHIAVALGDINIFVISNGNHFGRFTPYPEKIYKNYYPVYHPAIERYINNYKFLVKKYGHGSTLNINDIKPEKVISKIESVIGDMSR